jgi:hypothetical protein
LRFGEKNASPRMCCGFGNNVDPNNPCHWRIRMETIEVVGLIIAILCVIYIGVDAIFDRMGM